MKAIAKVAIALIILLLIAVVAVGYVGLVKVPGVTSTPQTAYNSYEVTDLITTYYDLLRDKFGDSLDLPELSVLNSYGLEYHFYGTDDVASVVEGYYDYTLSGWSQEFKDSGPNWAVGLYQKILYGFGYAVGQDSRLKQLTGYNTIYFTIEGPATAWAQLISDIEEARS